MGWGSQVSAEVMREESIRFPIPNSVRNEAGLELSAPACGVWSGYPLEKKSWGGGGQG